MPQHCARSNDILCALANRSLQETEPWSSGHAEETLIDGISELHTRLESGNNQIHLKLRRTCGDWMIATKHVIFQLPSSVKALE